MTTTQSIPKYETITVIPTDFTSIDEEIEFFQNQAIDIGLGCTVSVEIREAVANLLEAGLIFEPGDEVADFQHAAYAA